MKNPAEQLRPALAEKKQLDPHALTVLIQNDPGSFALYQVTSPTSAKTVFYSADRPSFCGYSDAEYRALAANGGDLIYPADRARVQNDLLRMLRTGEDTLLNYRVSHKVLGFVWIRAVFRFLGFLGNEPIFFASFLDNGAETELFHDLLNHVKTMVFVIDYESHQLLYANKAGLDYCQKGDDYTGKPCFAFVRNETKVCPTCFVYGLKKGEAKQVEHQVKEKGIWQSIFAQRIDWCGHDAIVQTVEDVSVSRQLQAQLLKEKNSLEDTIASIPVGISIFQKVGETITRISMNEDVLAIKGVSHDELMKDSFLDIFKRVWPSDKDRVIQDTKDVFIKGTSLCIYRTRNEKTGLYIWLRREGRAVTKDDGSQLAYFCYVDITAEMESEEALRHSQERYTTAVKGGHIAVWEYDFSTHSFSSPENSLSFLGVPSRLANVPESLLPFFDPSSEKDIRDQFALLDQGVEPPAKELWLRAKNGVSRCYQVVYSLAKDEDGEFSKAYGVAQDVTVQKRLEDEYAHLSQEFLSLNPEALCSFRLNLSADLCTGGHGSSDYIKNILTSTSATGFFAHLIAIMSDEEDIAKAKALLSCQALIEKYRSGEKNLSLTYRRQMADGARHWVTTYIALVRNPHTGEIEALLYSLDSNETIIDKLISERLTTENYEFTGLINVKTGKIVFHDPLPKDGTAPHFEEVFDRDVARAAAACLSEAEQERFLREINLLSIQKHLAVSRSFSYSFTIAVGPAQGAVKALTFTYLDDSHQEILLARSDISAAVQEEKRQAAVLQKALDEAKKANLLKTDFISNISHDMRTPLNGVIGYTEMALESNDIAEVKEDLKKIKKSGELLMSLINDTLDLSKIENGRILLQKTPASLPELFKKIATSVAPSIAEKSLHFGFAIKPENPAPVSIDVLKVTEIVNNLLSNAIKFTPAGGHVWLSLDATNEKPSQLLTTIIVKDDGVGMSEAFLAKAFEPFSQERTEKNADIGGSGLGLSIVRQLVHFMGGEITLNSALGKGTAITIVLPMEKTSAPLASGQVTPMSYDVLEGKRVLLVEDNKMNAEIAKNILRKSLLEVDTATNGAEALTKFIAAPAKSYDAILMDIRMPIMNGFEAAKAIRSSGKEDAPSIPILAMTADAYEDDIKRCLEAGMNAHVSKPIDRALLLQELAQLLTK
jgi:signal transduction histidine kinase/CheY-like chemotaxis protein/PAS domain-containing protein